MVLRYFKKIYIVNFEKIAEKDKVIIKDWIQGITKLGPFSPGKSLSDKEQLEDAVVILEVKEPKKYATRKGENLYITKKEIGYQKDDIIYFTIRKGFAFEPTFKLHFAWFDEDYQYELENIIEKTARTFSLNNQNQKDNIIDAIKISCRKVTKEITGKKPITSIKLIKI